MGYKIRFAQKSDSKRIIQFVNENWTRYNILNNEKLFKYYFENGDSDRINFVIAENDENSILGVCGFIYANNALPTSFWGSIWKTIRSDYPILGAEIIKYMKNNINHVFFAGYNVSNDGLIGHRFLRHKIGDLSHYYRLNDKEKYIVADVCEKKILPITRETYRDIIQIKTSEELLKMFVPPIDRRPYKDNWYICRRYFEYPFYQYKIYGLFNRQHMADSIMVFREAVVGSEKVWRIVDFIGADEDFAEYGFFIQEQICINNYEYVDIYCYGLEERILNEAGFVKRDSDDINIIPNYLEPLLKQNINFKYITEKTDEKYYIFKADADQDKPNLI